MTNSHQLSFCHQHDVGREAGCSKKAVHIPPAPSTFQYYLSPSRCLQSTLMACLLSVIWVSGSTEHLNTRLDILSVPGSHISYHLLSRKTPMQESSMLHLTQPYSMKQTWPKQSTRVTGVWTSAARLPFRVLLPLSQVAKSSADCYELGSESEWNGAAC